MAAEGHLKSSWSALASHRSPLGALLKAPGAEKKKLGALTGGLGEIGGRSTGGGGALFGRPLPLGSATIKDYLVRNNNQHQVMEDLNTPWAKGPETLRIRF